MDPTFLSSFLGGKGLPGFSSSSSAAAQGGTMVTPWYQGDIVVSYGSGDARSGDRVAPAPLSTSSNGVAIGAGGSSVSAGAWIAAIAIVGVGVAWRLMSK